MNVHYTLYIIHFISCNGCCNNDCCNAANIFHQFHAMNKRSNRRCKRMRQLVAATGCSKVYQMLNIHVVHTFVLHITDFTALHCIQRGIGDWRPSVRLSVCQTREM